MLKEREQKILNHMKDEIKKKGYPPTVREICAALGIKSTSILVVKHNIGYWKNNF